jgi:hypothetical protein
VATLTYAYRDSTAVVGPLALRAEPGCYDLCDVHSTALTVPRGWEVIRLPTEPGEVGPSSDDLMALADAIRRIGLGQDGAQADTPPPLGRRHGHLAVVVDDHSQ